MRKMQNFLFFPRIYTEKSAAYFLGLLQELLPGCFQGFYMDNFQRLHHKIVMGFLLLETLQEFVVRLLQKTNSCDFSRNFSLDFSRKYYGCFSRNSSGTSFMTYFVNFYNNPSRNFSIFFRQ